MKHKRIILIAAIIAGLIFTVACTPEEKPALTPCVDDNYSSDHAVNVERCLQSMEDGTAYEIDEALTAKAPWKAGDVVAKFRDGEGGYILREFLGITKAGYYLVQDYATGYVGHDYPNYDAQIITNEQKATEPFALMNFCAVTDPKTSSLSTILGMPSVCGTMIKYYIDERTVALNMKEQGDFLDGIKHGEWLRYFTDENISSKERYVYGKSNGVSIAYTYGKPQPYVFSYYDNGQAVFSLRFAEEGIVQTIPEQEQGSAFAEFNENDQTIQHGYWVNGEKTGTWRKWDLQGNLLEEINYSLKP